MMMQRLVTVLKQKLVTVVKQRLLTVLKQRLLIVVKQRLFTVVPPFLTVPLFLTVPPLYPVHACNAVFRTHQPHWIVAVDPKMMLEIAETDYVVNNKVYSNYNGQYQKHQKLLDHVTWSKPSLLARSGVPGT